MSQSQDHGFATRALQMMQDADFDTHGLPIFEVQKRRAASMIKSGSSSGLGSSSKSLKRSRLSSAPQSDSFDMGGFLQASRRVEETIAFPAIEWPSFDDEDESSTDSRDDYSASSSSFSLGEKEDINEDDGHRRRKRQCRGLTRCNRSNNLLSLCQSSVVLERQGSNGSLY